MGTLKSLMESHIDSLTECHTHLFKRNTRLCRGFPFLALWYLRLTWLISAYVLAIFIMTDNSFLLLFWSRISLLPGSAEMSAFKLKTSQILYFWLNKTSHIIVDICSHDCRLFLGSFSDLVLGTRIWLVVSKSYQKYCFYILPLPSPHRLTFFCIRFISFNIVVICKIICYLLPIWLPLIMCSLFGPGSTPRFSKIFSLIHLSLSTTMSSYLPY